MSEQIEKEQIDPKIEKEQIEKEQIDKIYNCDCLEDEVSPDNTGETTDGKGKISRQKLNKSATWKSI